MMARSWRKGIPASARMPFAVVATLPATARPTRTRTSAVTVSSPGPARANWFRSMAADRPAGRTYGDSTPGRMTRCSVRTTTSNAASTANGFITTMDAFWDCPVVSSGRYQMGWGAATHRSAAWGAPGPDSPVIRTWAENVPGFVITTHAVVPDPPP